MSIFSKLFGVDRAGRRVAWAIVIGFGLVALAMIVVGVVKAETASGQPESAYRLAPQFIGEVVSDGVTYPKAFVVFRFLSDSVRYADSASARAKGKILLGLTIRYERRMFFLLGKSVYGLEAIDTTAIDNIVSVDTARTGVREPSPGELEEGKFK